MALSGTNRSRRAKAFALSHLVWSALGNCGERKTTRFRERPVCKAGSIEEGSEARARHRRTRFGWWMAVTPSRDHGRSDLDPFSMPRQPLEKAETNAKTGDEPREAKSMQVLEPNTFQDENSTFPPKRSKAS